MHLTTLFHGIQSEDWTKSIADLNRNILRNVGKGWFSRVEMSSKKLALLVLLHLYVRVERDRCCRNFPTKFSRDHLLAQS